MSALRVPAMRRARGVPEQGATRTFALAALVLLLGSPPLSASNIAASSYAWSENAGWLNFAPSAGPGVTVGSSSLSGYAWSENFGWISLSPVGGGGVLNNGSGTLSGYAWGENAGWINFAPSNGGVAINGSNGQFSGYAWGENIGWINFSIATPVVTTWRAAVATIELVADINPSILNQLVTFTATVSGSGATPAGNVTFKDGTSAISGCANVALNGGGIATCATGALSTGTHTITAAYGGDGTYPAGVSAPLAQNVASSGMIFKDSFE